MTKTRFSSCSVFKSTLCVLCLLLSVTALGRDGEGYRKFDNAIRRFLMSGLDSTYICCPPTSWEVPFVNNVYGNYYRLAVGNENILESQPAIGHEIGLGIGYHGLDFVYTIPFGDKIDNYFEFNFYDNYWGLQLIISGNTKGDTGVNTANTTISGYFAFNGKKFSYPASFYGNYRQMKSAGSPMITFWYDHIHCWNKDENAPVISGDVDVDNFALCGGYGYNWALLKGDLVFNLGGSLGMVIPYWGLAAQAKGGVLYWICDYFRLNLSAVCYFEQGSRMTDVALQRSEWKISLGCTACFGKIRKK